MRRFTTIGVLALALVLPLSVAACSMGRIVETIAIVVLQIELLSCSQRSQLSLPLAIETRVSASITSQPAGYIHTSERFPRGPAVQISDSQRSGLAALAGSQRSGLAAVNDAPLSSVQ